jgi:hypothetical protein
VTPLFGNRIPLPGIAPFIRGAFVIQGPRNSTAPESGRRRPGRRRLLAAITSAGFLAVALAGCSASLTAKSSCQDFLNASPSDQAQAIDKIAPQENAPDATTPLGMPNVSYLCAGAPQQTLGWAVQQTR